MLTPNPRFLALPLIALLVITALGLKPSRDAIEIDESTATPVVQQMAHVAKNTLVR